MKRLLVALFVLFYVGLFAQSKGSGVLYFNATPTLAIDTLHHSEIAYVRGSDCWWGYGRDTMEWIPLGSFVGLMNSSGVPGWVPGDKEPHFIANSGDSLFQYRAGSWRIVGGGADLNGIYSGDGTVPAYTHAALDGTFGFQSSIDTSGFSISLGSLYSTLFQSVPDSIRLQADGLSGTSKISITPGGVRITTPGTGAVTIYGNAAKYAANYSPFADREIPDYAAVKAVVADSSYQISAGTGISITGTQTKVITNTGDLSTANEVQTIDTFQIVSNVLRLGLSLTGQPFQTVDLSAYLDNTDAQSLTFTGGSAPYTLDISGGSDVTFNSSGIISLSRASNELTIGATEIDGSITNEIQRIDTLSLTGSTLGVSLSGNSQPTQTISLAPLLSGYTSGAGLSNRLAYWTGSNTLGYESTFYVDSTNSRLGIGVSSPISPLEVAQVSGNSSIKAGSFEIQPFAVNNSWFGENLYFDGTYFRHRATGYGSLLYFYFGGLQIRTSGNKSAGSIADGNYGVIKFNVAQNGQTTINSTVNTGGYLNVSSSSSGDLIAQFQSTPTTQTNNLMIFGNGTIGINTATPNAALSIKGTGATSSTYSLIVTNSSGTTTTAPLVVRDDNVVGIGTNSPAQTLHVAGTQRLTGSAGTPTNVMGRDANGDIANLTLGSGLTISGGALSLSGIPSGSGATNKVAYWSSSSALSYNNEFHYNPTGYVGGGTLSLPYLRIGPPTVTLGSPVEITVPTIVMGADAGQAYDGRVKGTLTANYKKCMTIKMPSYAGTSYYALFSGADDGTYKAMLFGNGSDFWGSSVGDKPDIMTFGVSSSPGSYGTMLMRDDKLKVGNISINNFIGSSAIPSRLFVQGTGNTSSTYSLIVTNSDAVTSTAPLVVRDDGKVGIGTNSPAQTLHVAGTQRLTGSAGTPTNILGRDANGDISNVTLGSGLSLSGGSLTATGTPGGSSGQIQYNSSGSFAGSSNLTWSSPVLTVTGRASVLDASNNSVFNNAGGTFTTASQNIIAGKDAGRAITSGTTNTTIGVQAMYTATTASSNFALGLNTLYDCTSCNSNIAIGNTALGGLVDASSSIGIGTGAGLFCNVNHSYQIGSSAGYYNNGPFNTFYGYNAGYGASKVTTIGGYNVGIGFEALKVFTSGAGNVAIGKSAGSGITTGSNNVVIGYNAFDVASTASGNVAIGMQAGESITSGLYNTCINYSGAKITTGSYNTAIGFYANGEGEAGANYSVCIGYNAGGAATELDDNIFIGRSSGSSNSYSRVIGLGLNSAPDINNQIKIGSTDYDEVKIPIKLVVVGKGATSATHSLLVTNSTPTTILAVRNDSKVGVLTSAPAQTFHVEGTARITGSTGTSTSIMGRDANGDISAITVGSGLSLSGNSLTASASGPAGQNSNIQFYKDGSFGADHLFNYDTIYNRIAVGVSTATATGTFRGNASISRVLLTENESGTDIVTVLREGYLKFGNHETYPRIFPANTLGSVDLTRTGLIYDTRLSSSYNLIANYFKITFDSLSTASYYGITLDPTFAPVTTNSAWTALYVGSTINQTGGSAGITRGIQIAPLLTSAYDYRALEISNTSGKAIYQTSTGPTNILAGNTSIGSTNVPTSTLDVTGSLELGYVEKTTTYTAGNDHTINCTSGTFTVNLPTAVGITGRIYVIKNSGSGTITVDGNGSETIDGATTQTLVQYDALMIQSTGSNWIIL